MSPTSVPPGLSRRSFLATAAAGALATTLPPGDARAATAATASRAAPAVSRPLPRWFDDVKLGVFIHWNAAAIPAFAPVHLLRDLAPRDGSPVPQRIQEQVWRTLPYAEMYQNTMAVPGSETGRYHAERYGDLPYDAFVARFRDETLPGWDPHAWAELFARSGAGYVVLTTKTEDGFLLWPSARPNPRKPRWQAARDVTGELADAVRARGLRFGVYYCEGLDWTFGGLPITDDAKLIEAMPDSGEYAAYTDAHWRELITRYRPSVLWNDYGFLPNPDADALFGTYYAQVPDGVVNDRFDIRRQASGELNADFVTLEYAETAGPSDRKWEACRGLGTSFGYNRLETDADLLGSSELIHLFADIVASGGNLLINVGPTGTGEIPSEQRRRLIDLGRWIARNGEAVRGTRPRDRAKGVTTEGLPVRYTVSDAAMHAIVLGRPRRAEVDIDVRLAPGTTIRLSGERAALRWEDSPHGTRVTLPGGDAVHDTPSLSMSPAEGVRDPE